MFGFSVSISGIRVGLGRLDVSANNIANLTTPGFKSSRLKAVDRVPGGTSIGSIRVDFSQGPIEVAEGGFSLAIQGDGFFRVETPQGERFTRAGAFGLDADRNVVTAEGHRLRPGLQVPMEAVSVMVGPDGTVSAVLPDGSVEALGQVMLTRFPNPGGLVLEGGNLAVAGPGAGGSVEGVPGAARFGSLVFGALEGSNVDLTSEIVSQIISSATVKANIAGLKTRNDILGTIVDLKG